MHRKTIFEKVAEKFHTTPEEVINYAVGALAAEQR